MIGDIRILLSQKQQLLLDVSHELRSPLARMRLLVEMLPNHKNRAGLVDEIIFLEGMISNLLLSTGWISFDILKSDPQSQRFLSEYIWKYGY